MMHEGLCSNDEARSGESAPALEDQAAKLIDPPAPDFNYSAALYLCRLIPDKCHPVI
jgi:hypothetical protein